MHYWCLGLHLSDICWLPVVSCGSDFGEFWGHLESWRLVISAMPLGLLWHPSFQAEACLWWASRDTLEESHFLPELWTSNFPSGTQNDPVTHEQRYFFGKLVSISSLHTSQHSIFPTCQVKYAVVYPHFLFLSGTKQAGACTQGFVNQGVTWQFYGLCILLQQLTFLLSCLWSLEFSFSALPAVLDILIGPLCTEFTHFWTCFLSSDYAESCVEKLEVLVGPVLMSVMVMSKKCCRVKMAAYVSTTDVQG